VSSEVPTLESQRFEGRALDGRSLGKRGALTRQRLLDATAKLLETHGVRDLRVVDIAREVGTSPATFYQYFRDVEEAVLALAEGVAEDLTPVAEALSRPWSGDDGIHAARMMVKAFMDLWDRHRAVVRTRNLAAQEGDPRFRDVRNASLRPLTLALADRVRDSQRSGAVGAEISPVAAAAAMVAMTERMAAFHREVEELGMSRDELVETTAQIIARTTTGA
jgi:AcrR family transcriptional regulator